MTPPAATPDLTLPTDPLDALNQAIADGSETFRSALSHNVLVLNRTYQAIRVVNVRRAFGLLVKEQAEVVHVEVDVAENGAETVTAWQNLSFSDWSELSELRAEFEPEAFDWVRTVRMPIAVPRIIRLLGYDKLPRQDVKFNRRNIFARDHNTCQYCTKRFPTSELSLDHVVPRAQDGPTTWENIVTCCIACNVRKGGRTPREASMKLLTPPVKPKRSPALSLRLSDDRYRSWKQFLNEAYWTVELK